MTEMHHPHLRLVSSLPPEDGVRVTKSFLIGNALTVEDRLLIVYNVLRIMLSEHDPDHECGPNTFYNRLASATFFLLAEFAAQFPKEAARMGIFVGAETSRRKRRKGAGR